MKEMNNIETIGSIVGSTVAVWGIVKYPYSWVKKKYDENKLAKITAIAELIEGGKMYQLVKNIESQFHVNGGSTLKDSVVRLENGVNLMHRRMDDIEDKQKFILNSQSVAFWYSNDRGECIYASPALCRKLNLTESDIMGNSWIGNIEKRDVERVKREWLSSMEEKRVFDEIYCFKSIVNPIHAVAYHRYDKVSGKYLGTYGTITSSII